ncbi:MAG: ABC transporter ATP-binding protein [bacterium]|jgi:ABC-2 type transport system ATP-binding protein
MNDAAITVQGLSKEFGGKWVVRDLEMTVPRGAVFGLLGPNGAGKSTTINMILGLLPPSSGQISILGLNPLKQEVQVRQRVGYVPEIYGFYGWMSVRDTIALVAAYHQKWNWELCKTLQEEFRLQDDALVQDLSKGMRAKLSLLLALSFEPEMLVLDEPTSGLDPAARRNFIETILGHYQESGKTIVLSSHLLNEFSGLLDYAAFLREGRVELVTRLDELYRTTKRVRLIFNEAIPANLSISNAISRRVNGREVLLTYQHFDPEITPAELSQTGASNVVIEEMTLEDIFVDMVQS